MKPFSQPPLTLKKPKGFTLIEVMIAFMIFSLCAYVLIKNSGQTSIQQHAIEQRQRAQWIAADALNALRLTKVAPVIGMSENEINAFNQDWNIKRQVSNTSHKDMMRVEILVASSSLENYDLARLVGYIGRH